MFFSDRYGATEEMTPILLYCFGLTSSQITERINEKKKLIQYEAIARVFDSKLTSDEIELLNRDASQENLYRIFQPRYERFTKPSLTKIKHKKFFTPQGPDVSTLLKGMQESIEEKLNPGHISPLEKHEKLEQSRSLRAFELAGDTLEKLLRLDVRFYSDGERDFEAMITKVQAARSAEDSNEFYRLEAEWLGEAPERLQNLSSEELELYERELEWEGYWLENEAKIMGDAYRQELKSRFSLEPNSDIERGLSEVLNRTAKVIALIQERTEHIRAAKTGKQLAKLTLQPLPEFGALPPDSATSRSTAL